MQPSENPVRAKFAEHAFHALGRIEGTPTPRGWLAYATTSTTSGRRASTPPLSRMFAGEQRAIGELMIWEGPRPRGVDSRATVETLIPICLIIRLACPLFRARPG